MATIRNKTGYIVEQYRELPRCRKALRNHVVGFCKLARDGEGRYFRCVDFFDLSDQKLGFRFADSEPQRQFGTTDSHFGCKVLNCAFCWITSTKRAEGIIFYLCVR